MEKIISPVGFRISSAQISDRLGWRKTKLHRFLHKLGHYLRLDEGDLERRGLG